MTTFLDSSLLVYGRAPCGHRRTGFSFAPLGLAFEASFKASPSGAGEPHLVFADRRQDHALEGHGQGIEGALAGHEATLLRPTGAFSRGKRSRLGLGSGWPHGELGLGEPGSLGLGEPGGLVARWRAERLVVAMVFRAAVTAGLGRHWFSGLSRHQGFFGWKGGFGTIFGFGMARSPGSCRGKNGSSMALHSHTAFPQAAHTFGFSGLIVMTTSINENGLPWKGPGEASELWRSLPPRTRRRTLVLTVSCDRSRTACASGPRQGAPRGQAHGLARPRPRPRQARKQACSASLQSARSSSSQAFLRAYG